MAESLTVTKTDQTDEESKRHISIAIDPMDKIRLSGELADTSIANASVDQIDVGSRQKLADAQATVQPTNKPNTSDLDLNMIGSSGFNCLHAACGSGNIEMTEYLLFKR